MTAYLHEVFSGIQGEGPLVGVRQVFARFSGCNLACRYCDTPASRERALFCRIEENPGERDLTEVQNPLSVDSLVGAVTRLASLRHHSVSVTGGEPLVQADFLATALPRLRELLPVYLETNGTLADGLARVVQWCDWVATDIKLTSATGGASQLTSHRAFLEVARRAPGPVFAKIVVTADADTDELRRAFALLRDILPEVDAVLQPVTEHRDRAVSSPTPSQVLRWQELGLGMLRSVRVIPQTHTMIGQR